MENLKPLEQQVLKFLKELADLCDRAELHKEKVKEVKNNKCFMVSMSHINNGQGLRNPKGLKDVAAYLQKNGLSFILKDGLINDSGFCRTPSYVELFDIGEIGGESIEKINTKIKRLITDLTPKVKEEKIEIKVKLKNTNITYEDTGPSLIIDKQRVQIPPFQNEHYFCRAMYEYKKDEAVDWSSIYEKMTGYDASYFGKPDPKKENWRMIYDAIRALNNRIKECANTEDEFFKWQLKTVKRNF